MCNPNPDPNPNPDLRFYALKHRAPFSLSTKIAKQATDNQERRLPGEEAIDI